MSVPLKIRFSDIWQNPGEEDDFNKTEVCFSWKWDREEGRLQLASSSGKTAPEPWLTVLPLCHFEGVVLFLLSTRTLAACLCPRKAMLRCTCLLSKEDESSLFGCLHSVCTCIRVCRRTFTTGARGWPQCFAGSTLICWPHRQSRKVLILCVLSRVLLS